MRNARGQVILFATMLFGPVAAAADTLSTVPEAVAHYARDLDLVMKGPGPTSLERVFEEGVSAAQDLTHQLERFDDLTYHSVQHMMTGFTVFREEALVAEPLPDFFLKLAREKGTSADQAFFETLQRTYPDSIWPAYKQPVTDYSACVIFDGKTLTDLYGAWLEFQKSYPYNYRPATQKELTAIEEAATGTCACGDEDSVITELAAFSNAYPAARIAPQVASQLEAVRSGTSNIRFNCRPQ
jgi:hypothetical protein